MVLRRGRPAVVARTRERASARDGRIARDDAVDESLDTGSGDHHRSVRVLARPSGRRHGDLCAEPERSADGLRDRRGSKPPEELVPHGVDRMPGVDGSAVADNCRPGEQAGCRRALPGDSHIGSGRLEYEGDLDRRRLRCVGPRRRRSASMGSLRFGLRTAIWSWSDEGSVARTSNEMNTERPSQVDGPGRKQLAQRSQMSVVAGRRVHGDSEGAVRSSPVDDNVLAATAGVDRGPDIDHELAAR